MNELTQKIYQFIQDKLGVKPSAIHDGASFYDDLEVDSLDFCELVAGIEHSFNITIPDEQAERLKTVGALIGFVHKQLNQQSAHVHGLAVVADEQVTA